MDARLIITCTILMLATGLPVQSQETVAQTASTLFEISGTVKDATGAVLPGVLVGVKDSDISTNSDNTGYFLLKGIPAGQAILVASLPGFAKKEVPVQVLPGRSLKIDIVLEIESQQYSVLVEQETPKLMGASESIGVVTVMPSQIASLPSLGEKDVFRSIQLMPGVSASNESSSGLYVRGGTPDQNLVLFDGFTVYKVDHFFGIFSAFNASAVDNITMFKGGFDSKYGGRISSVVDLAGKTGNKKEFEIGGGVSLLSFNGYADGPLGSKGTFTLAARRSFQSPFSSRIQDNYTKTNSGPGGGGPGGQTSTEPSSWFYDVNGRATYTPTAKDTLVLSLFFGVDDFDNSRSLNMPSFGSNENMSLTGDITDRSHWGNGGTSLSWQRNWTAGFASTLTAAASHYFKNSVRYSNITRENTDTSDTRDFNDASYENNRVNDQTVRWANSLVVGRSHYLEFGAEAIHNTVNYDYVFNEDIGKTVRRGTGLQTALYFQDRYQPFSKLEITPGLRATRFSVTRETYFEPRLSAIVHATSRLRFKAAGGLYHQFIADLVRENPMQGDQDFWTLADNKIIPVSNAKHYIAGASYETEHYLFDVEGYRKNLGGLTQFGALRPPSGPPPGSSGDRPEYNFDSLFFTGTGKAEGVEFLAQKKFGDNTGWLTYALGRVMYDFPGLSDVPFPASHDSTHEFKIVDNYRWKRFTFSGNWVYATGKPFTAPTGSEEVVFGDGRSFDRPIFGATNGERLPDYHRLDLSATWDFHRGESSQARIGVSVFNAYNHANVWRREYMFFDGEKLTTDVNYLGITVSAFLNVDLTVPSEDKKAGPAWNKEEPKKEENAKRHDKPAKVYDFCGNVVLMGPDRVTVRTGKGTQDFILVKGTIKGESDYEKDAYVHIYYRQQTEGNVVTMIVRKVKDHFEIPANVQNTASAASPGGIK